MHSHSVEPWRHEHVFLGAGHARNERRTWIVIGLTAVMMVGEIIAGFLFGSMALLADGFHMATHAGALTITAVAYLYARRQARNERFTFGTGKLGELAAYTSAVILSVISLLIGFESAMRLMAPVPIRFNEAIAVAVAGLAANLVSAWLLQDGSPHTPHHDHGANSHSHRNDRGHDHHHGREDYNLRAAYFHVLADALTSVLAIVGLLVARFYGWIWVDPLIGIIGSLVIARWSWGLLKGAGAVLLDTMPDKATAHRIRNALGQNGDSVADLHLWRVGPGHLAAIISVISDHPQAPEHYKAKLSNLPDLSHVTIEVHTCTHMGPAA
jgi:cation diffusion facilitator family transporter